MNKRDNNEMLSALADGELVRRQARRLLRALADSGAGLRAWKRYHLIGGVLRDEHRHLPSAERIARRVAQSIASEPLPAATATAGRRRYRSGLGLGLRFPGVPQWAQGPARWSGGVVAMALAGVTAVAVVAVVVVGSNVFSPGPPAADRALAVNVNVTPSDRLAPQGWLAPQHATRWSVSSPDMEQTMNSFLVEHGEFSGAHGINGLTSYVRFVGYDEAGQ